MRRSALLLALGLTAVWFLAAFSFRLYDMRRPRLYISALTGGQRFADSTLAWIEGALPSVQNPSRGRLVVVDVRLDGKIRRHATALLPQTWRDCHLWLEASPTNIQAVARCPGHTPLRLSAGGGYQAGLGPDDQPPPLLDVFPLLALEPDKIVSHIHRHDAAPRHPLLFFLGLFAVAPILWLAWRDLRTARRLGGAPILEGTMEQAGPGSLTIRDGHRRVAVYVEQGEVISVGLGRGVMPGDAGMAVDGLPASVQGEVEGSDPGDHPGAGFYRGQPTLRLRRGGILVVGDQAGEAQRRLVLSAVWLGVLSLGGAGMALLTSLGLLW